MRFATSAIVAIVAACFVLVSCSITTTQARHIVTAPTTSIRDVHHHLHITEKKNSTMAYKPIIFMHGFSIAGGDGDANDWNKIRGWLAKMRPQQKTFALNLFGGVKSHTPMFTQVAGIKKGIEDIIAKHPKDFANGWHAVGHSQGGLLMRSVLSAMDNHGAVSLISLAGVQAGYYGEPGWLRKILGVKTAKAISHLMYSWSILRDHFSVAQYWKSPLSYNEYLKECRFLPFINNERQSVNSTSYKKNFLAIKKVVLFGSPQDGLLSPWDTSLFNFYNISTSKKATTTTKLMDVDESLLPSQQVKDGSIDILDAIRAGMAQESDNESSSSIAAAALASSLPPVVDMTETVLFRHDTFGLATMHSEGRLVRHGIDGVPHSHWLHNKTNFIHNVLPHLD